VREKKIILPEAVSFILRRFKENGYRADIVGGPVRDFILGKSADDYDVTTDALPEDTKRLFKDKRVLETGIKHGTLTVLIDGVGYEVTTYRIDGEYKDNRHPERVEFTSRLKDDLARRDFTMNAICYNPEDGFTDPFRGEEDIRRRLIRAVGDPERRFTEDALRILRAIRFSSTLGFDVEEATRRGVFAKKNLLCKVSEERIYTEWKKLLSGDSALSVFDEYREVIAEFLPEIKDSPLPDKDAFLRADYMARLLSLFALSGKGGEEFYLAARRLKTDSATAEDGRSALDALGKYDTSDSHGIGRLLYRLGERVARLTASVTQILEGNERDPVGRVEDYLKSGKAYKLSDLAVGGGDLIRAGLSGREIGQTLDALMLKVIDGECENEREALLKLLCR
jgi:tRNA nucleotidyltransferase (CCA-adding enzyme)